MNTRQSLSILAKFLILIGVGIACYRRGAQDVLLNDFKTYQGNLVHLESFSEDANVDLKAFSKARYYYFANRIPKAYLGAPYDFGPVDFKGLGIGKGPTTAQHEYLKFKALNVTFIERASVSR